MMLSTGVSNVNDIQRKEGAIVLTLSPKRPTPTLPYELHNHVSPDDWAARVPAVTLLASKYHKPIFERVWALLGLLSIFIFPCIVYRAILRPLSGDFDFGAENVGEAFVDFKRRRFTNSFEARVAAFGVMVGTLLLFLLPMLVWKLLGRSRVNALIGRWALADANRTGFVPIWIVKLPSMFSSKILLTITTPTTLPQPSLFHPNAYMPAYINPPKDDYLPTYTRGDHLPSLGYSGLDEKYVMDTKV